MFFLLSKILASLFHPLTWIIVLLLVSFLLRKNALKITFRLVALFMLIIFSNSWLTYLAVERWEHQISDQFKSNAAYDVAIVLGGGMVEKDSISGNLVFRNNTDRIMQAVELYRQHEVKKILICGGSAKAFRYEVPEALLLKEYLVANSIVPLRDIWIDTVSRNTRENAVEAKKLLGAYKGPDRFLLVTSAMHMKRSMACFMKAGLDVTPYATDRIYITRRTDFGFLVIPKAENLLIWNDLFHEWVGWFTYRVAGYL